MKLDTCILYKKAFIRQMENVLQDIKKAHHKIKKMGILGYSLHRCPFCSSSAKYIPKQQLNWLWTKIGGDKKWFSSLTSLVHSYWAGQFTCSFPSGSDCVQSRWVYIYLYLYIYGFIFVFIFFSFPPLTINMMRDLALFPQAPLFVFPKFVMIFCCCGTAFHIQDFTFAPILLTSSRHLLKFKCGSFYLC